jgi:ABC-type Fe3+-siderophore transport system permease subunit
MVGGGFAVSEWSNMAFIITMAFIGIAVVVIAVVLFLMVREASDERAAPLRRKERRELLLARIVLSELRELGIEYKAIDTTDLPFRIIETIEKHNEEIHK